MEEEYLEALLKLLDAQVKDKSITRAEANNIYNQAKEGLARGAYGPELPFLDEIYGVGRSWWRPNVPWQIHDPEGEKLRFMYMPPEMRYFSQIGLSPSEALSWTKFLMPPSADQRVAPLTPEEQQYQAAQLRGLQLQNLMRERELQGAPTAEDIARGREMTTRDLQAMARQATRREEQAREKTRREFEQMFEQARQERLGQLDNPVDWIERWRVEHEVNPFLPEPGPGGGMYTERLAREQGLTPQQAAGLATQFGMKPEDEMFATVPPEARGLLASAATEFGQPPEPAPGVPIPPWLARMMPQLGAFSPEFGERQASLQQLAQAPVRPVSGQWWQRMLPSEQQGFMGLVRQTGRSPEDMFAQMMRLLPQPRRTTPTRPRRQTTFV